MRQWLISALFLSSLAACNAQLPDAEEPGAKLYAKRCSACHRLHPPQSMMATMWEFQVERMQGEMARRGFPPLRTEERLVILDYLKRHSQAGANTTPSAQGTTQ